MSEYRAKRPSNPSDDWKLWLVVNPGTWLMPILMAVLVVALAVHAFVYANDNYNPLRSDVTTVQAEEVA
ncbi:light-harvesting antenna LH1, alpha subunit [Ectothiorhodospira shaposhnikovii]|uniref:light-harvesting antenna LH1, alpha subunit n=1 Tax=Ectothiorhodospira shaposhnikovii TaxID=1054 RepID=UPI001EE973C2|nr:light-harvesting antenna LH1, alpha subunit [Ectothiorhodospira shaposhnikovii]MCG5513584.1 light-harvesting protein [Ectothiorhodospira shaposhnikovii]